MAEKKPIEQGIVARVTQGLRYIVTGSKDVWFGPGDPLAPQEQQIVGRQWDYPVFVNQYQSTRSTESVTFDQLRALADSYDVLRIIIETRKDQVAKLKWTVSPIDATIPSDSRCDKIEDFLKFPDQEHDFGTWLRALLEDMLVIDAATIYPRFTKGGALYSLDLMDGATIKRVIDGSGRTPVPPDPAYQQIIKGLPAVDYSRDQLIYCPRNVRTNKMYGYSPVEQIIMTVNIAIRRQIMQLQYFTEGNIPEAIIGVPATWSPEQVKDFQQAFDSFMTGNTALRRRATFVPADIAKSYVPTKEAVLKDDFDEWLTRICCFCFSVSPTAFTKSANRATAESSHQQALEEGLAPVQQWIKRVMDLIIWKYFKATDLEFSWSEEEAIDPLEQAQVSQIYLQTGVLHPDEVRADLGLDPLSDDQKEDMKKPAPIIVAGQTPQNEDGENENTGTKDSDTKDDTNNDKGQAGESVKAFKVLKKKVIRRSKGIGY